MSKKNQVGQMLLTHNNRSLGGKKSAVERYCLKKKRKTRKGNKNNIWILIQTFMHDKRK